MRKRKRSDRNHLIYELVNTINNKKYVGVTVCIGRAYKYTAIRRFQKHVFRAKNEPFDWALYKDMRKFGPDVYDIYVIQVIRGKSEAHRIETNMLQSLEYKLNSTHK